MLRSGMAAAGVPFPAGDTWAPSMAAAVRTFQTNRRLTADGIPGKNTWHQLGPSLGPITADKARVFLNAALELRGTAYMLAIHSHGIVGGASVAGWAETNKVKLLAILQEFDEWMQRSGARGLMWRWSWPDGVIPPGTPTYDGTSDAMRGELGVLPLIVAGPPVLLGSSAGGAAVTAAIVETIGAAAAAAGAAWLGVKLATWATANADAAPDTELPSRSRVTIAPPVGMPPPPNNPQQEWEFLRSLRYFAKRIGALAAMIVAVLVSGFGVVASLAGAAVPVVTAAAGAAGALFWLGLAAIAAFLAAGKRRRRAG